MDKKKTFKIIMYIVTCFLLIYIIKNMDFILVLNSIQKIPLYLLFISLGLQIVTESLLSYQWYRIAKMLSLSGSYIDHYASNCVESFFDAISPGAKIGGEVMRVFFLKDKLGYTNQDALSLLAIQKAFSVFSFLILSILSTLGIFLNFKFIDSFISRISIIVFSVFLLWLVMYFLLNSENIYQKIKNKKNKSKILISIEEWLKNFNIHICKFKSDFRELFIQILISFLIWIIYPIKLFILVSYFQDVNFFYLLAIVFISYFLGNIPILPGGLVAFEGSMTVLLMSMFHISYETSFALSIIFRFVTYWFVILISLKGVFLWKHRKYIRQN